MATEKVESKGTGNPEEDARIARAGRIGRQIGTIVMVLFSAWFVGATVYNFAVDVFFPVK